MDLLVVCGPEQPRVTSYKTTLPWLMTAETRARIRGYRERKSTNKREEASSNIESKATFVIGTGDWNFDAARCSIDATKSTLPFLARIQNAPGGYGQADANLRAAFSKHVNDCLSNQNLRHCVGSSRIPRLRSSLCKGRASRNSCTLYWLICGHCESGHLSSGFFHYS